MLGKFTGKCKAARSAGGAFDKAMRYSAFTPHETCPAQDKLVFKLEWSRPAPWLRRVRSPAPAAPESWNSVSFPKKRRWRRSPQATKATAV